MLAGPALYAAVLTDVMLVVVVAALAGYFMLDAYLWHVAGLLECRRKGWPGVILTLYGVCLAANILLFIWRGSLAARGKTFPGIEESAAVQVMLVICWLVLPLAVLLTHIGMMAFLRQALWQRMQEG